MYYNLFPNIVRLGGTKPLISLLLVCLSLSCCPSLFAQSDNERLIQTLVDKNVLTKDEARQLLSSGKQPTANPVEKTQKFIRQGLNNAPYVNIGGYGLLMYQYKSQAAVHNDFKPRVVFLWLEGKITDHFRYFIMPEFVSPTLYEYYAEWMPSPAFKLRGGQFKVPFTLENPISLVNLESVQNSRTVSSLAGMGSDVGVNNGAGRDIGIQISGSFAKMDDHDLIQYAAGVFQGAGINNKENNNVKDFAGTLALQPVKGWRIAGGLYAGQSLYAKAGESLPMNHVRNRWALSTDYTSDRFFARAEWIKGNDAGIDREGVYGTGCYYFVPKKLSSYVKIDHYNSNKSMDQVVDDYSLGVNYYIAPLCRFQVNYQYSDYSKEWTASKNSHTLSGQLQIYF